MANIVVGVSGSIAAYKAVLLVRELLSRGHRVRVVMSAGATEFVSATTFGAICGEAPFTKLFDEEVAGEAHVRLSAWADAMAIVPATANVMAKLAHGLTDDPLTATVLCFDGPLLLAPSMHHRMWERASTQRNAQTLQADGVELVGPTVGALASGDVGMGRMAEPLEIANAIAAKVEAKRDLEGQRIVVSAGATQEDVDPVRFMTNRSSGKMGYAIAECAASRGATVTLISAPTALAEPRGVQRRNVRSAVEMQRALEEVATNADVVIMAAAVADYRPAQKHSSKLKKNDGPLTIEFERNPDILKGLGEAREGSSPLLVGFALETDDVVAYARKKLDAKKVDLIVANHAADSLGRDTNRVTLVSADAEDELPELPKSDVATRIVDWVAAQSVRPGAGKS